MAADNAVSLTTVLLADRMDIFRGMGSRFRDEGITWGIGSLLVVVAVALTVAGVLWLLSLWSARSERKSYLCPHRMFRELCRAQKLKSSDIYLLRRIARASDASSPLDLFLDPRYFSRLASLPEWQSQASQLAELQARLFQREAEPSPTARG